MAGRTGRDEPVGRGPGSPASPATCGSALSGPPGRGACRLTPARERRILDFIDANLPAPLDLKALSGAVGLTSCVFARQFRRSFGAPPYAFVVARRLARARQLLAATEVPIKAIAAECGFSDQAHLTRMFSHRFGETPAGFRRQARTGSHSAALLASAPGRVIAKPA